jgi:insulysin
MGNKKHPQEAFLNDFLKRNGGMKNGVTGPDHTQFFFEVKSSEFSKACEYFSEYLISPKFDQSVMDREIKIIEQEFKKNIPQDDRAAEQIEKTELAVEGNAIARFSSGNAKTLTMKDICAHAHKFFDHWYSANLMNIVMYSNLPISE